MSLVDLLPPRAHRLGAGGGDTWVMRNYTRLISRTDRLAAAIDPKGHWRTWNPTTVGRRWLWLPRWDPVGQLCVPARAMTRTEGFDRTRRRMSLDYSTQCQGRGIGERYRVRPSNPNSRQVTANFSVAMTLSRGSVGRV